MNRDVGPFVFRLLSLPSHSPKAGPFPLRSPRKPLRRPPEAHGIARISRLTRLLAAISAFSGFWRGIALILRRPFVLLRLRMNWFVNLGLNSNSNHFATCLLIFILHYSPQSSPSILDLRSRWSCDRRSFRSHGEPL